LALNVIHDKNIDDTFLLLERNKDALDIESAKKELASIIYDVTYTKKRLENFSSLSFVWHVCGKYLHRIKYDKNVTDSSEIFLPREFTRLAAACGGGGRGGRGSSRRWSRGKVERL